MKLKSANIEYLRGSIDLYDLQAIAQLDIEQHQLESESLFQFAYLLDPNKDMHDTFIKTFTKIKKEFGLLTDLAQIQASDIKDYFSYKLDQIEQCDHLDANKLFFEFMDFYAYLEENHPKKIENLIGTFKENRYENMVALFAVLYKDQLHHQILNRIFEIYYDLNPDQTLDAEHQLHVLQKLLKIRSQPLH